jgi:hypothetical protein
MARKPIERLKKLISPRTFYEELAEVGELRGYLLDRQAERFSSDEAFRREMIELLYIYSDRVVPEVEVYYLEKMAESLAYFLEYTKQWKEKNH